MAATSKIKVISQSGSAVAADTYTTAIEVSNYKDVSFQLTVDYGDFAGTVYLQYSNDGSTFVNSAQSQAISADASYMLFLNNIACKYVRLFFDRTSGTLTSYASVACAKGY